MLTSQHANALLAGFRARRMPSAAATAVFSVALAGICACASAFNRQGDSDCQRNLKEYSLALLMYVQDYDEQYPPMKFPAQVEHRVYPYVKNPRVFSCPVTQTQYLPNPALNYLTLSQIGSPATMMVLRDAKPHTTDTNKPAWNAAFVDGAVKLLTAEPPLGKPAPTPRPLSHSEQVRGELQTLRQQRQALDVRIHQLEREQRRKHSKH